MKMKLNLSNNRLKKSEKKEKKESIILAKRYKKLESKLKILRNKTSSFRPKNGIWKQLSSKEKR
jgi:hypothetical protein